ncbi:TPA: hypothetical protein WJM55_000362 [Neisseria meningitidis]|uniref:hypothetical protein n=1 Tax=Neisseria meningitidis TaxID=487 RepID=UPI000E1D8A33|nr:hypothetical protein [Neisseria meningitidis]
MNKLFITALSALALSACAGTWEGAKQDTARNLDKTQAAAERAAERAAEQTGNAVEKGWDKTKEAVKKGGNAVGRGISHLGGKIENATE